MTGALSSLGHPQTVSTPVASPVQIPEKFRDLPPPVHRGYDWIGVGPTLAIHLLPLAALWTGATWQDWAVCVALYWVRMFAITAFYHRYFSHRTFKTSRLVQFIFAVLGNSSVQRGPLWWAAHHRRHHKLSDQPGDSHSPVVDGFLWAHIGWITADCNMPTDYKQIPDWTRYPELVLLNRFDWFVPLLMALALYLFGSWLGSISVVTAGVLETNPLHTSGAQMLVWGFFVSTVVLFHCTASINSLTHMWGSRRYETGDDSRNNMLLALVTMGEGWHNNHHRYQGSVRQGFYWWEVDLSFYILKVMEALGLVWDLRPVPAEAYSGDRPGRGDVCKV